VNTAHELQFASFNSLEEVVDKEEKMTEHVRVVLAREKELSETVNRLKQVCAHCLPPTHPPTQLTLSANSVWPFAGVEQRES
jgi:hypothetical protein